MTDGLGRLPGLTAHFIRLICLQRWTIELLFRRLKVYANFEQMISHSLRGIDA